MNKETNKKHTHKDSAQIKSAAPMNKDASKKHAHKDKDSAPLKPLSRSP
jgi:hypothetical protein